MLIPGQVERRDVVVVGGGIHGCAVARELARRGRDVLLLERLVPGTEASTSAVGILSPLLEFEGPGSFFDLSRRSFELYPAWVAQIEEEGEGSVGYEVCGGLLLAFDEAERSALLDRAGRMRAAGIDVRVLEGADVARRAPGASPAALAALDLPREAQLDPIDLMGLLPRAARRAGVQFRRDRVRGISPLPADHPDGARLLIEGDELGVAARHVVLAAGAWSTRIPGVGLPEKAIRPARGEVVMLQPEGGRPFTPVLMSPRGYAVSRADGRVLCGSTLEFVGFRKEATKAGRRRILELAEELCPGLAGADVVDHWAGLRPYTADHHPLLGAGRHPGLWMSTGHFRNGILLAPASAEAIADLVCGEIPAVDLSPFDPLRLPGAPAPDPRPA